jgi:hypothetical protein
MVQRYEQMRRLQWYKCGAAYIPHDILTTHYQILHIIVETSVLGASVSSIMSGRICYCVGTYKILRRDVQDATSGRNFGNTKNA